MTNYNENTVTGPRWTRCMDIHIHNPFMGVASIVFGEEDIISIEGSTPIHIGKNQELRASFDQLTGSIPLINPSTGEPMGTSITHVELYTILYSLYIQKAVLRDSLGTPTFL